MLKFFWYAPTHGDTRYIASRDIEFPGTPSYIATVARAAEAAGFDGILVPTGPTCADAFVIATFIAGVTQQLKSMVAVRTGSILPTVAAKMAATLDQVSGGRLYLNIVTGGSPLELAMDGDLVDHDSRYDRTSEFLEVLIKSWEEDTFSFEGKYFAARSASFKPRPVQRPRPRLYLGGSSTPAVDAALRYVDTYLMWGEPIESIRKQIAFVRERAVTLGRTATFGMRINLIVEKTREAAWHRADEMLSRVDGSVVDGLKKYFADADSQALQRIQALRGKTSSDPCFWTGMVPFRTGNSTALVGSVDEITESLMKYVDAGISEFIFSAYPHSETVAFIGEALLKRLKAATPIATY